MITLNLDLGPLLNLNKDLRPKIDAALEQAAQNLAMQSHAHLLEQVQDNLHSTREKYVNALTFQQVNKQTWVINLDQEVMWIEEGLSEHEMIDNLLNSPKAKIGKDGTKYMVIPFQHNKGPSKQTQAGQDLASTIKQELKSRNISYGKIERDDKGKAKTGLLHSFDINKDPLKTHEGPGQGHGPVGQVRQGNTKIPLLQGVRIYQKEVKGKVRRDIMTFRVVSSKHRGSGKWVHPGLKPRLFMDETAEWAMKVWDKLRDEVLKSFNAANP